MMDNRIFNVNGESYDMLLDTLRLAFLQESQNTKATAYVIDAEKGMILLWSYAQGSTKFPTPLDAYSVTHIVQSWLDSHPEIGCHDWDEDVDHDGRNVLGWRVYCENWGHVGEYRTAICAIKPVYLWIGK